MKQTDIKILLLTVLIHAAGCSAKTHGQDNDKVQTTDIIAQLDRGEHVYLDSCIVWGDLDFTALHNRNRISANLTQIFVEQSVTFNDCVFTGKIKAFDAEAGICVEFGHNLSFTDCDFRGDVDLTEITVGGNAFFTGSIFRHRANLQGACFHHKKTYFNKTHFEKEALFQNVVFAGDANFIYAVFDSLATFQKTVAGGLMFFGNARFNGYADFTYTRASESIFKYAEFKERYDFVYSQLNVEGMKNGEMKIKK